MGLFILSLTAVVLLVRGLYSQIPDISHLVNNNTQKTAHMIHREGSGIETNAIFIPLDRIAPELQNAVIAAEDANFNSHRGIDWEAVWDAAVENFKKKRVVRGGSTITQQLAKNLYLSSEKTMGRKTKELLITFELERRLDKPRILELYLNVVEWGRGIYGAEAAARHYFGKPASDLTIEEASWLAAILPSPLRYDRDRKSEYARKRAERIAWFVERRMGGDVRRLETEEPPPEPEEEIVIEPYIEFPPAAEEEGPPLEPEPPDMELPEPSPFEAPELSPEPPAEAPPIAPAPEPEPPAEVPPTTPTPDSDATPPP